MDTIISGNDAELYDLNVSKNLTEDIAHKEDFKPTGAIAFFILLIMLCVFVWYGIYFLMLQRN